MLLADAPAGLQRRCELALLGPQLAGQGCEAPHPLGVGRPTVDVGDDAPK